MIKAWIRFCAGLQADQKGAAGVDYVLLAALLAIIMLVGLILYGDSARELFATMADTLSKLMEKQ